MRAAKAAACLSAPMLSNRLMARSVMRSFCDGLMIFLFDIVGEPAMCERWAADRLHRLDVEAKTLHGAANKPACGQFSLQQRMILRPGLGPDHEPIAINLLATFLSPVKLLTSEREHLKTSGVVDLVLAQDLAP